MNKKKSPRFRGLDKGLNAPFAKLYKYRRHACKQDIGQ
jgi:hypothetical protein